MSSKKKNSLWFLYFKNIFSCFVIKKTDYTGISLVVSVWAIIESGGVYHAYKRIL